MRAPLRDRSWWSALVVVVHVAGGRKIDVCRRCWSLPGWEWARRVEGTTTVSSVAVMLAGAAEHCWREWMDWVSAEEESHPVQWPSSVAAHPRSPRDGRL